MDDIHSGKERLFIGSGSPRQGFAITPHQTNALTNLTTHIYVGGNGNLVVETADGTMLTFIGVLVGTLIPIRANKVLVDTGDSPATASTTATNLVGLY